MENTIVDIVPPVVMKRRELYWALHPRNGLNLGNAEYGLLRHYVEACDCISGVSYHGTTKLAEKIGCRSRTTLNKYRGTLERKCLIHVLTYGEKAVLGIPAWYAAVKVLGWEETYIRESEAEEIVDVNNRETVNSIPIPVPVPVPVSLPISFENAAIATVVPVNAAAVADEEDHDACGDAADCSIEKVKEDVIPIIVSTGVDARAARSILYDPAVRIADDCLLDVVQRVLKRLTAYSKRHDVSCWGALWRTALRDWRHWVADEAGAEIKNDRIALRKRGVDAKEADRVALIASVRRQSSAVESKVIEVPLSAEETEKALAGVWEAMGGRRHQAVKPIIPFVRDYEAEGRELLERKRRLVEQQKAEGVYVERGSV